MAAINLFDFNIAELGKLLAAGELSSVEVTQHSLMRAEKAQQQYNLFVSITPEQALQQAAEVDKKVADKSIASVLGGIPYAAKDVFCIKDTKTSCGSRILDNFIAPYDATAVAKIKQSNGVMLGKTNLDEFAMGSSNEHSYYGEVSNPWDRSRVPGGSSGGSAVAVAAGVVPYALGTDTGGSVRQPAAFCGISGIKPTYGRVSRYGMVAYASSLDQAGIFAHSARDLAQVLQVISGADTNDSTCSDFAVPDYIKELEQVSAKGLKIGLPDEFMSKDMDPRIAKLLQQALNLLEGQGAKIVPVSLPNISYAIPCYYTISLAEASANLARYDGVRYGYRSKKAQDLRELYMNSRNEAFGDEVKKRILLGTYVLTTGYYDAYYLQAQKVRRLIREDFSNAYKKVDVIAGPVTPSVAFKKGEKSDPLSMYLQDIYTVPANLAGLPAMSLPMGFVDNMPVGMQLLGNYFNESLILATAKIYQSCTDWHKKHPTLEEDLNSNKV